jgi:hypothetical protein
MYIEKMPKSLLDDITSNRCIPFIGAGFSKNAKCVRNIHMPDWNELGKKATEYLSGDEFENAIESLSQYENQYSRANLIEMIAQELHINEIFPGDTHLSFCRLYFDLICTTNFDYLLENAFGEIYSKQGKPYHVITNENGEVSTTHSVAAGLDYPGVCHIVCPLYVCLGSSSEFVSVLSLCQQYACCVLLRDCRVHVL